jgi:hypothetical protein
MRKSTPTLTLTESGLLAVLLQRQRYKLFQLAWRRAHRKQRHNAVWSIFTWPWRALTTPKPLDDLVVPVAAARTRHPFLRIAPSGTEVQSVWESPT